MNSISAAMKRNGAARGAGMCCFIMICALAARLMADGDDVRVTVTEKVAGGTVKHLGGYGLAGALANPDAARLLAGTDINCTKFWIVAPKKWRCNGEFLGPDYKEVAIRQATKYPDTVNWPDELGTSTEARDLISFDKNLRLLKDFGAQPVLNFKTKLFKDEIKRRMYWRHAFLMNFYVNKVRKYNFTLWEFGCEDQREGPEQLEVGTDAVREAEKITGVRCLISGPGEDGDVDKDYKVILKEKYADRIDGLSFHTFQWPEDFPALGAPGEGSLGSWRRLPVKRALQNYLDGLQKDLRPNAPLLPYWDTGWSWRTAATDVGPEVLSTARFTSLAYIGRIIQECESRALVNLYCRLYGSKDGDALRSENGKVAATPLFYAIRMMARAGAGDKERLAIKDKPDDALMQALATRSGKQVFVTCLSRERTRTLKVTLSGLAEYQGKGYVVRRHEEKLRDEVSARGTLDGDLTVDLPPLTAFQVAVERE